MILQSLASNQKRWHGILCLYEKLWRLFELHSTLNHVEDQYVDYDFVCVIFGWLQMAMISIEDENHTTWAPSNMEDATS